mgnify:CR=1 FL=1
MLSLRRSLHPTTNYKMNVKTIGILLTIIFGSSFISLHGADQAVLALLVKKGLLTEGEVGALSAEAAGESHSRSEKALADLLVDKGHLTRAEAEGLAERAPKVIVEPKEKEADALSKSAPGTCTRSGALAP